MTRAKRRALNRFFALLRRTRGWGRSSLGIIRKEANFSLSSMFSFERYCPLTAACRLATKKPLHEADAEFAGKLIGIHWRTAYCLMCAADGETNTRVKRAYRRRLLEATGLEETL